MKGFDSEIEDHEYAIEQCEAVIAMKVLTSRGYEETVRQMNEHQQAVSEIRQMKKMIAHF